VWDTRETGFTKERFIELLDSFPFSEKSS